jgi:hypothetical protein
MIGDAPEMKTHHSDFDNIRHSLIIDLRGHFLHLCSPGPQAYNIHRIIHPAVSSGYLVWFQVYIISYWGSCEYFDVVTSRLKPFRRRWYGCVDWTDKWAHLLDRCRYVWNWWLSTFTLPGIEW